MSTTELESPMDRPSGTSGRWGRWRRWDPLVPLTALVSLAVVVLQGFDGAMIRDIGVYSYGGQKFAEGVPPYVAIVNRAGPLAHVVPGIGAWVADRVGLLDVYGMRGLFALLSAAAVAAAYVLARDLFGSKSAGLAGAAALLCLHDFVFFATNGPREKTTMLLLTMLALIAVAHRRWATAGVLIGLATLTWQPVLFAALPAAAVAALLAPRSRIAALVRIAVGGLVPLGVTAGIYALLGRSRDFWDCFLLINLHYTQQTSPIDGRGQVVDELVRDYGWTLWLLLAGLALSLVWAVWAVVARGRREPRRAAVVATGVLTVGNLLWAMKAFNGPPDAFVMFPGVVVGVGGLVPLVRRALPGRGTGRVAGRVAVGLAVAWAVAAVTLTAGYALSQRNDVLLEQQRESLAVKALLPPGSRWLSQDAPQPLVLAHETNLTRFQLYGAGLKQYVQDTWPHGMRGYRRYVNHHQPAVVVVGKSHVMPWLQVVLQGDYHRVGHSPGWAWYARADLGRPLLVRIRDVLA